MRKRSKKRIPQDIKPWIRVQELNNDKLSIFDKKTIRWNDGSQRDWNTKVLNSVISEDMNDILLKSFITTVGNVEYSDKEFKPMFLNKLTERLHSLSRIKSLSRYKHHCLFTGRGRTYNRSLSMARHNLRKLVGLGLISGLIK